MNGTNAKGYSSRALLSDVADSLYFYFGGYVGSGNISSLIYYDGEIQEVIIEAAFSISWYIVIGMKL